MRPTIDLAEAAAMLKVDEETMRRMAADGTVYGAKIGRSWVFLLDDLLAYLHAETRAQTARRRGGDGPQAQPAPAMKRAGRRRVPPALPKADV